MSTHHDIAIQDVWTSKSQALIDEIIATWKKAGALPKNVNPAERAQEVVMVTRKEQQIIGITTAKKIHYAPLKNDMFFLRGFIVPDFRIPGLFAKMITQTLATLEANAQTSKEASTPIGVIAEIESPRLKKANVTRLVSGMTLQGFTQNGNPVYVYYFEGARY